MRTHQDDRGIRYCDVFPTIGSGELDITILYPGAMALWHRHENQTDYQIVIHGALKILECNMSADPLQEEIDEWKERRTRHCLWGWPTEEPELRVHYSSERSANPEPVIIQPGLWHGSFNFTNEQATLVYYITQKYDPNDEFRMDYDASGWDVSRKIK